jgi:hypothetical protein
MSIDPPVPASDAEREELEEREELADELDEDGRHLAEVAFAMRCNKIWKLAARVIRAAALLRQPAPVAVIERPWDREGWCDESGHCWWGRKADELCNCDWHYSTWTEVQEFCSDAMPQVALPASALPIPKSPQNKEVQP